MVNWIQRVIHYNSGQEITESMLTALASWARLNWSGAVLFTFQGLDAAGSRIYRAMGPDGRFFDYKGRRRGPLEIVI